MRNKNITFNLHNWKNTVYTLNSLFAASVTATQFCPLVFTFGNSSFPVVKSFQLKLDIILAFMTSVVVCLFVTLWKTNGSSGFNWDMILLLKMTRSRQTQHAGELWVEPIAYPAHLVMHPPLCMFWIVLCINDNQLVLLLQPDPIRCWEEITWRSRKQIG